MTSALERWLLRRWYGGVAPGPGLRLLSLLYAGLLRVDRALYRWEGGQWVPVPEIVSLGPSLTNDQGMVLLGPPAPEATDKTEATDARHLLPWTTRMTMRLTLWLDRLFTPNQP